ncbi:MAG: DUF4258 domain-containing protein [Hoeflea sp.]|uniref:DUF4258 domain-containing protein n=1 Tax=Hoeflea sp. TaxID=1940281 RepID=UPI001DE10B5A|nr:DUF4258 domain-containing protein [Hoeflea sp.]MBU4530614.1 DUF4258 domain-containing protein [Alphaproteobacteria bacterium]MBU4544834.1 DUF4258 domain-containing protein [Alphaproteobacteria bacterium]MBU4551977.1 DUF4258 domain-containing protein [Alphaproteobacteria bacterium]MBV1722165.1 DUF4258 domain-containing protein [Hoeflea sp.]MBV1761727.1 DUF4258 domain-containing protein [Hoeflea sp.]
MGDLADQLSLRIESGRFRVSDHAQGRMDERGILLSDVLASVPSWSIVETYEVNRMGLSLLAKHELRTGPVHAVWGMIEECAVHAVLVTVDLPDKETWDEQFTIRRKV